MYAHIISRLFDKPLLVYQPRLDQIVKAMIPRLIDGVRLQVDPGDGKKTPEMSEQQQIAVIPVHGTLVNRQGFMNAMSEPLMSYEEIGSMIESAAGSGRFAQLVLDIDSNGGEAAGAFDLSDLIYNMRGSIPITAIVDSRALSAGYAIASAADRVIVSRTSDVGSVGVVAVHLDESAADADDGLKYTYVFAGNHKVDYSSHKPLTDSAKDRLQAEVDRIYGLFVETVARNRSMTTAQVRSTQALVYAGADAVSIGFADAVQSPRDALHNVLNPRRTGAISMSGTQVSTAPEPAQTPAATPASQPGMISIQEVQQIIADCNKAGVPSLAARAIADGVKLADLPVLFGEAKQIREACRLALNPAHADTAIAEGKTLTQVKAELFDQITAKDSAFRKSETVASKAAFLHELIEQDQSKPTQGAIAPDAGYNPAESGAKNPAAGPKAENQKLWDSVWSKDKPAAA